MDEYLADFGRQFWRTGPPGFWKLERQQTFQEPYEESWHAFARGDWDTALATIAARRPSFEEYYDRVRRHGFATRRTRVVELPVSPRANARGLRPRHLCDVRGGV